jgi:hypothetical protein
VENSRIGVFGTVQILAHAKNPENEVFSGEI